MNNITVHDHEKAYIKNGLQHREEINKIYEMHRYSYELVCIDLRQKLKCYSAKCQLRLLL